MVELAAIDANSRARQRPRRCSAAAQRAAMAMVLRVFTAMVKTLVLVQDEFHQTV